MAKAALRNVLLHSPQYSGQFAASWNLSIGTPVYTSTPAYIWYGAAGGLPGGGSPCPLAWPLTPMRGTQGVPAGPEDLPCQ